MDDTYQAYINRIARLTLEATYQTQLPNIQKSPKFAGEQAVGFPGYSVITPPAIDDTDNRIFYDHLGDLQQELLSKLPPQFLLSVPAASFHVTIADLIWDKAYEEAIGENPLFVEQLKQSIKSSFDTYEQLTPSSLISQWRILGLIIFPRSLGVGLLPQDESSYDRIIRLRRSIYQNSALIALGVEQQYYYTAHVTLGYFGTLVAEPEQQRIAEILSNVNERYLEQEFPTIMLKQAQLRRFPDMTRYEREANDPILNI